MAILLLCLPNLARAQQGALDDALRWFPPGTYEGFLHLDRMFRPADDINAILIRLVSDEMANSLLAALPFLDDYESVTLALAKSVDLMSPERRAGKKRRKNKTGFIFFWREMAVLRGSNLPAHILAAEKAGHIEKLNAKPAVYSSSSSGTVVYIHPAVTGEVLLCENKSVLVAMIATGMGRRLGILDDPNVAEMLTYVPSAPVWFIVPVVHKKQAELTQLIDDGADDAAVESKSEAIAGAEQYYIAMVDAEDDVVYRELYVFSDSEIAESAARDTEELENIDSPFDEDTLIDTTSELNGRVLTILKRYSLEKLRQKLKNENDFKQEVKEAGKRSTN